MSTKQQNAYAAGVVEGLAYSRFLRDRPNERGMQCIYDWFYKSDANTKWKRIETWFSRHRDKPVGPLLYVLIKKECGD